MALALRRNILVFHLGALGDFVVTWPLALALARIYPQSRIFYVTHGQKGALAEKVLRVESADIEAGWHHLYSDPAALPEPARKLLAGAHTVVTFTADPTGTWVNNVRSIAPEAKVVPLSSNAPEDFAGHVTDYHLEQLKLHPWPAAEEALRQILRSVATRGLSPTAPNPSGPVVLHPGAGSPRKCWPADHFLTLARRLIEQDGRPVRVLLGEAEQERWGDDLAARFSEAGATVHHPPTLLNLHAELSAAGALVGNDSGPAHLAGLLGIPTVALFGPSNPTRWHPLGPRVRLAISGGREEGENLASLSVDAVYDAVEQALATK